MSGGGGHKVKYSSLRRRAQIALELLQSCAVHGRARDLVASFTRANISALLMPGVLERTHSAVFVGKPMLCPRSALFLSLSVCVRVSVGWCFLSHLWQIKNAHKPCRTRTRRKPNHIFTCTCEITSRHRPQKVQLLGVISSVDGWVLRLTKQCCLCDYVCEHMLLVCVCVCLGFTCTVLFRKCNISTVGEGWLVWPTRRDVDLHCVLEQLSHPARRQTTPFSTHTECHICPNVNGTARYTRRHTALHRVDKNMYAACV